MALWNFVSDMHETHTLIVWNTLHGVLAVNREGKEVPRVVVPLAVAVPLAVPVALPVPA